MLHPSYTDLINAVNNAANNAGDAAEHPVVQSRYSIVIAAAKRGRQIIDGSEPLVAGAAGKKPLSTAVQELYEQKISIMPEEEEEVEILAAEAEKPEEAEEE